MNQFLTNFWLVKNCDQSKSDQFFQNVHYVDIEWVGEAISRCFEWQIQRSRSRGGAHKSPETVGDVYQSELCSACVMQGIYKWGG